jgi:glycogen debranching enzyme
LSNTTPQHLASSSISKEHGIKRPVLKCGDMFALFDSSGSFRSGLLDEEGLYFDGTRFLSRKYIQVNGFPLSMMGTQVRSDGEELLVTYSNFDNAIPGIPEHSLSLVERMFLSGESCYAEITVTNFSSKSVALSLSIHLDADYADIYEVRGMRRNARGSRMKPQISGAEIMLGYEGLDREIRRTQIAFTPSPSRLSGTLAEFDLNLAAGESATKYIRVTCSRSMRASSVRESYSEAHAGLGVSIESTRASSCSIRTSNAQFDAWWNRSMWDLQLLTTSVSTGKYPYAGVPWFNTPFGRDGLITGFETLWIDPELSRGVLAYLASTQATSFDPEQDAEPGKILHEIRSGEMAALHEMPFGRYYGSVDAPPLFVFLAGCYLSRSEDIAFIRSIWASIAAALQWMSTYGDPDGDGFLEYESHCAGGLIHQAWKDSDDAIFHARGESAVGALAICEVQGYCYAAYQAGAEMASILGFEEDAGLWQEKADALHVSFNQYFWCDMLGTYGIALDGSKDLCCVNASNAGQLLFSGIVPPDRASSVAQNLMAPACFSGWGVRTLSNDSLRFNPMSYHNGTVWPHDNAIIAYGLSRYGLKEQANRIFQGIFDAALRFDLQRLPELFCGFAREEGYGPVPYPVACSPQAWAAGAASLLLQSSLGIEVDGVHGRIIFNQPTLPEFLREVHITGLPIRGTKIDLAVRGERNHVTVGAEGDVAIQIIVNS